MSTRINETEEEMKVNKVEKNKEAQKVPTVDAIGVYELVTGRKIER